MLFLFSFFVSRKHQRETLEEKTNQKEKKRNVKIRKFENANERARRY